MRKCVTLESEDRPWKESGLTWWERGSVWVLSVDERELLRQYCSPELPIEWCAPGIHTWPNTFPYLYKQFRCRDHISQTCTLQPTAYYNGLTATTFHSILWKPWFLILTLQTDPLQLIFQSKRYFYSPV